MTVSTPTSATRACRLHSSPHNAVSSPLHPSLHEPSLPLSLSLPSTQQRNRVILRDAVLLGAAAAAAVAAGILAASTGRKRAPGSIPRKTEREKEKERRDVPLSCLFALGILVLRRSLVSQRWALPNYRLGIHNRTRRGALAGRTYAVYGNRCFIEREMKDDAEKEGETKK